MAEALKQVLCFTFNRITGPGILNNQFKIGELVNQGKNLTRWCGRPRRLLMSLRSCSELLDS
eukprot:9327543-Lingulodinium_polyedra.AAC.1